MGTCALQHCITVWLDLRFVRSIDIDIDAPLYMKQQASIYHSLPHDDLARIQATFGALPWRMYSNDQCLDRVHETNQRVGCLIACSSSCTLSRPPALLEAGVLYIICSPGTL